MISLPLFLLAAGAAFACYKLDWPIPTLIAALICGYALATSPLSGAIDGLGSGIGTAITSASQ
ncbi:hypothetical protein [Streptomyces niveus]|uniref:hypothetical protein n=1 Tax=Streptomyces niveus TaxID=193462 RepID=UPI0037A1B389